MFIWSLFVCVYDMIQNQDNIYIYFVYTHETNYMYVRVESNYLRQRSIKLIKVSGVKFKRENTNFFP